MKLLDYQTRLNLQVTNVTAVILSMFKSIGKKKLAKSKKNVCRNPTHPIGAIGFL